MNISYDWIKSTPVAIIEENELPSWKDTAQLVASVRACGAEFVRYPAIRWGVHTFGDSKYLPKYPGLGERDLFNEVLQAMHANGIKVMAYCHFGVLHYTCAEKHPEWVAREFDGTPCRWGGQPNHFRTCMRNDDFLSAMYGAVGELCSNYDFDALYLDGPTWYGDCSCAHCRKAYFDKSGKAMPEKLSFADGSQQILNQVRDDSCREIVRRIREIAPERLALMFNMTLEFLPTHRTGIPELTNLNAFGGNTTEIHRPGSFWTTLETLKLGEALDGVSLGYLPPGPYETLRNFAMAEIETVNGAYLMHGATPMVCAMTTYLNDTTNAPMLSEQVRMHSRLAGVYHESKSVEHIALVYPRKSFEEADPRHQGLIARSFSGTLIALQQSHRQVSCFFDTQITLERLKKYRAVALPGATHLDESALDALMTYVSEGGTVYLTGNFQAPSEFIGVKNIKERPAEPCHGREYRETGPRHGYSLVPEAYFKFADGTALLPVSDAVVGVPYMERTLEYKIAEAMPGTKLLAELYLPAGGAFGEPLEFPYGTPPAIVLNSYGKGLVLWCAADIGLHFESRRLPESREALAKLFDLLAGDFPVRVTAPAGVVCNTTYNATENRYYLHLLNYCGVMQECGCAVEWIAPVRNIKVSTSANRLIRLADGIAVEKSGDIFELPELGSFATYCFELPQ